ncbi:hypothetical protein AgCh_036197 [Apium graveolens]
MLKRILAPNEDNPPDYMISDPKSISEKLEITSKSPVEDNPPNAETGLPKHSLANDLVKAGIPTFGPFAKAVALEGSKKIMKNLCNNTRYPLQRENPRPMPKNRQIIQDRVKELRGIVPNSAKILNKEGELLLKDNFEGGTTKVMFKKLCHSVPIFVMSFMRSEFTISGEA